MTDTYKNTIEYSRNLQERYEYFHVGLNFTILALVIETAKFEMAVFSGVVEIVGWIFLFVSGVIAVLRLEMHPVVHKNYAQLFYAKQVLEKLFESQARVSTQVEYSDRDMELDSLENAIEVRRN